METEVNSSNRRLRIGLVIPALVLALAAVIVVVALVLPDGDSGDGAVTSESANLMPDDTFLFMTLNPHLDQAKNFEVIERAWGDNPLIRTGLTELLDSMQAEGLDYRADIEPWLGDEMAFGIGADVFTDLSGSIDQTFEEIEGALSGGSSQPPAVGAASELSQFIVAAATKDKAASDKFLDKLRSEAEQGGTSFQETEYKGIKIVYSDPGSEADAGMAYATIDGFVTLTGGGLESMQAVIDARDGANLSGNQNYIDVLDKLPADQISYGYIDARALMGTILEVAGSEIADLPSELFNPEQVNAFKGAGYSVGLEPNGMRFDFAVVYDKDALPEDMLGAQATTNKAAGRVSADALLYLSGTGLGNVVQMALDAVQAMPDQPEDLDEQLNMLTSMLGVSVEDLIEMLSGEFAIVITHDSAGIAGDPSIPVGASFLLEAQDEAKFQRLLNSLSALLSLGAGMEFPEETISGVDVTALTDPSSDNMIAGWGVGEGFFALGTSRGLLESAFGGGGEKLSDASNFQAATSVLPKAKTGMIYLSLDGLLKIVSEEMSPSERESFEEVRPLLAPIKAVGAASEPFDKGRDSAVGAFFILIESE